MTTIDLPTEDIEKTKEVLKGIWGPERLDEQLTNLIAQKLYTFRRDMIITVKRLDKERGKELEKWL